MDALFAILISTAGSAFESLDTPVHVPVVSDILNSFGVSDVSLLDLFCWVIAVPVTIEYKLLEHTAPFGNNKETSFLTQATSFQEVAKAFAGSTGLAATATATVADFTMPTGMPATAASRRGACRRPRLGARGEPGSRQGVILTLPKSAIRPATLSVAASYR